MSADNSGYSSAWSREENKKFENGLAIYYEDSIDRWEKIAAHIPGKSVEEVKTHYELLIYDVDQIESGCVPLPDYETSSDNSMGREGDYRTGKKRGNSGQFNSNYSGKASRADQERRKGIAWTEDEHRLFLQGLEKYGKGDWRSISRNFVVTRTPTQVASHAQKYFIRLNSMNKDRRRSSIHDITNNNNGENSVRPGPITGQSQTSDSSAGGSSSKPSNQPHQSLATPSGVGIYGGTTMGPHQSAAAPSGIGMYGGATIGQPIGGPLGSAMGTPMNLPQPAHVAYGERAPAPGQVAPGAPVHMGHVAYHMPHGPHSSAHR